MPLPSDVYSSLLLGQMEELGIFLHYPMADHLPLRVHTKQH